MRPRNGTRCASCRAGERGRRQGDPSGNGGAQDEDRNADDRNTTPVTPSRLLDQQLFGGRTRSLARGGGYVRIRLRISMLTEQILIYLVSSSCGLEPRVGGAALSPGGGGDPP